MSDSRKLTAKEEKQLAIDKIDEVLSNITVCELMSSEAKESTKFNQQVQGLKGLFEIVKELIDSNAVQALGKIGKIKKFLKENSSEKTDVSGTTYLGDLVNVAVHNDQSKGLAVSLKTFLRLVEDYSQGFLVKMIAGLSKTAGPRIKVLVGQIPTLEASINAYDRTASYAGYQSASSSSVATSSNLYLRASHQATAASATSAQPKPSTTASQVKK